MIQKKTILGSCTASNILKIKTFHLYSKRKTAKLFSFTKNSIKTASKKNEKLVGKKIFSFFCKSTFFFKKKDGCFFFLKKNDSVLLKKKKKLLGGFCYGFANNNTRFFKFKNRFQKIL